MSTTETLPPEVLTEPDPLLSEIATTPIYSGLVGQFGDPFAPVDDLVDSWSEIGVFGAWIASQDQGGQHRLEEAPE